jgi:FAD:protein FMN transferase
MGSPLRLTLVLPSSVASRAAPVWSRVRKEFARTDAALSGFRADSALTALNREAGHGEPIPIDRRLYRALSAAAVAARATGGRFDPRVLQHLERLGWPGIHIATPSVSRLGARSDQDDGWLARCPRSRSARLRTPVDLGGIGKGLALRWAFGRLAHALADLPAWGALLEAGGDMVMSGTAVGGGPWRIAIEDPEGGEEPVAVLALASGAVCTSSIRLGRWRGPAGHVVHHLIDPRTGEPADEGLRAVTVVSRDPAWAEVWSKALFVAGPSRLARVAAARRLAAWWLTADGWLGMTPAARRLTIWARHRDAAAYPSDETSPARMA